MAKSLIKPLVIITAIVAIVVSVLAVALSPRIKLPQAVNIPTNGQPTLGNKNAPVQIVAFEDLKCSNCMRYNNALFPKIKKKYIDTGIAKYTMIVVAFIPGSIPAANAALCLYHQNKSFYFPFVKYLYQHQPPEQNDWATIPTLLKFAKAAVPQANLSTLSNCIFASGHSNTIDTNFKLGMKIMNNQLATPTLYVNGMIVDPLTMKRVGQLITAAKQK